jgi:hypothetical protein
VHLPREHPSRGIEHRDLELDPAAAWSHVHQLAPTVASDAGVCCAPPRLDLRRQLIRAKTAVAKSLDTAPTAANCRPATTAQSTSPHSTVDFGSIVRKKMKEFSCRNINKVFIDELDAHYPDCRSKELITKEPTEASFITLRLEHQT